MNKPKLDVAKLANPDPNTLKRKVPIEYYGMKVRIITENKKK
jgi:hypothetical protein